MTTKQLTEVFTTSVVGVTFQKTYPKVIFEIDEIMVGPHETQWISLVHEPDNEHDPNAVGVWWRDTQLGHIPRDLAARLAKEIDEGGHKWLARVEAVLISPENPNQPGIIIRCKREEN